MKKAALLFVLIIAISAFANVSAQDTKPTPKNRTLSKGFSIKIEYGIPSASYGTDIPVASDWKYGITVGLQIGNQWYFNPGEKLGFGLMVNWFDCSFAAKSVEDATRATIDLSVMELGPIATYALSNEMAIDAYYNLRPTMVQNFSRWTSSWGGHTGEYSDTRSGYGFTNALGAGFRWRALSIGMEYEFGSVSESDGSLWSNENTPIMKVNGFRILFGAKF